jgi:hypothetical protein
MSAPGWLILAFLGLVVSAQTRLTATVLGSPVSVPVLGLVALAVVLALAAVVLFLLRSILRDGGLRLRPRTVGP